jgi:hypothetical protein
LCLIISTIYELSFTSKKINVNEIIFTNKKESIIINATGTWIGKSSKVLNKNKKGNK